MRISRGFRGQITVLFEGSAGSQEINGTFSSVPCGNAFSAASTATLGVGCTSRFSSSSTLVVWQDLSVFTAPIRVCIYGRSVLNNFDF